MLSLFFWIRSSSFFGLGRLQYFGLGRPHFLGKVVLSFGLGHVHFCLAHNIELFFCLVLSGGGGTKSFFMTITACQVGRV